MKVLHLGKFYWPKRGGIESVVQALAEGEVRSGIASTVLCFGSVEMNQKCHVKDLNGVKLIQVRPSLSIGPQPLAVEYARQLRRIVRNYDLVHLHLPHPLAEFSIRPFLEKVRVVVTHHADIVGYGNLSGLVRPLRRSIFKRAQKIVSGTETGFASSKDLKGLNSKKAIVPFGSKKPETLDVEREDFALFVGRLVPYKGVEHLIEAVARRPIKVKIVGSGPLETKLIKLARKLGVMNSVEFLGEVPDDELSTLYARAKFLVLPSISNAENYGIVVAEAMSHGCPVISTLVGSGLDENNIHGKTGITVPPADSLALSKAIETLESSQANADRLSRGAREFSKLRFDPDRMVRDYVDIYEKARS